MSDSQDRPTDRKDPSHQGETVPDEPREGNAPQEPTAERDQAPERTPEDSSECAEHDAESESKLDPSDQDEPSEQAPAGQAAPRRKSVDESGMERPTFLLDFPSDPELDRLIAAFEKGNYAFVRAHAGRVLENSQDEAVREAARELVQRIEPDPLAKYLLWISLGLLVFLVLWAYTGQAR